MTPSEYESALARAWELMDAETPEDCAELSRLADEIEKYEDGLCLNKS